MNASAAQLVEAGTELIGEATTGERLTFTADAAVAVSGARIAVGATYQDGALQLMPGIEMPEAFQARGRRSIRLRSTWGRIRQCIWRSRIFRRHISASTAFSSSSVPTRTGFLRQALELETWCIFGNDGDLTSPGILRPKNGSAGTKSLHFLVSDTAVAAADTQALPAEQETPNLPNGFYGSRIFLLPVIPPERRFVCRIPRGMDVAIGKIFGREAAQLFAQPRAWIRISFPKTSPSLHQSISTISMHAMTVSNVECFNQTVYFDQQGTSIPISREAGTASYLVAPLSVFGETHTPYLPEFQPSAEKEWAATPSETGESSCSQPVAPTEARKLTPMFASGSLPECWAMLLVRVRWRHF